MSDHDDSIARRGERLLAVHKRGGRLNKGDLRVLGLYLNVATMNADNGYAYRLRATGETICVPGRRQGHKATLRLRAAIDAALHTHTKE
ncbi:MAG: hypothetical protein ACPG4T_03355 [Nannocystaceae bacterium]